MTRLHSIVIYCRDPYVLAPFWSQALGIEPVEEDADKLGSRSLAPGESVLLHTPGQPQVWITPVERLDPPGNRLHLDVDGGLDEVERLIDLGGRHVRDEVRWSVLTDPEGNDFCVVPGRSRER
jgi:hypothetical protein